MSRLLKHLAFPAIAALLLATSCTKEHTCAYQYEYQTVSTTFKGFTKAELQSVQVTKYAADGTFSDTLSTLNLDLSQAVLSNDTAYSPSDGSFGLIALDPGADYEIKVTTTGSTYRISDIHAGDASYSWTQKDECSMGASQAHIVPYLLKLNGQNASTYAVSTNHYLVCLVR